MKRTKEQFIIDAKKIHCEKKNYDKFVYNGIKIKSTITCKIHGDFIQQPDNHLQGKGCYECGREKTVQSVRKTSEEFIIRAKEIHNNRYGYENTNYHNAKEKVVITCREHGDFFQSPDSHLSGAGCPECWCDRISKEEFVEQARLIHGDKYTYDSVDFLNKNVKVGITCKEHGIFEQLPTNHLKGNGCPHCVVSVGFTKEAFINKCINNIGTLYVIQCWNNTESFIKIGITSTSITKREPTHKKYKYRILHKLETFPDVVWEIEHSIHKENKQHKYKPLIEFGGYTECYTFDILEKLPELIQSNQLN